MHRNCLQVTTEYGEEFKALVGEHVLLVESLNDSPKWIDALKRMVSRGRSGIIQNVSDSVIIATAGQRDSGLVTPIS